MIQAKNCSICKIPIEENYCGRCGQKISGIPTSTISLIRDFIANFFSLERSGLATILKTISNPKSIVSNYYDGNKNYYASPGKILLYGIAVVALHIHFVDKKVMGITLEMPNINAQYLFWIILYPFLLLISYITFIRTEKAFSKHLISITYVASALFIVLTILNDSITLIWGDKLGIWAFVLFVSLIFVWNSRVFTSKNKYLYLIVNTTIQITIFIGLVSLLVMATSHLNG